MKRLAAFLLAGLMAMTGFGLAEEDLAPDAAEESAAAAEEALAAGESETGGEETSAQEAPEATAWYEELYKDTDEQVMETPKPKATTAATETSGPAAAETPDPESGETADSETSDSADEIIDDGTETEVVDGEPYQLTEDPENGRWEYHSANLNIVIERVTEKVKVGRKTKTREYCIADIQASPESPLYPIMTEATKKRPAGYRLTSPRNLVKKYRPLFALSDDLYGIRLQKYDYKGIVIRNGEIIAEKTRNSKKKRNWPNLDTMMLLGDGSMKALVCDAYTAQEYLDMGATQVFSFGPILISDGEINEQVLSPKYYPYNEPRVALGMVEPYHYIAVVVRGRPTNRYAGVHLDWLAQLMKERGCVEALNLDGGLTATMMFNGKAIETGGSNLRSQGSMICFGTMPE